MQFGKKWKWTRRPYPNTTHPFQTCDVWGVLKPRHGGTNGTSTFEMVALFFIEIGKKILFFFSLDIWKSINLIDYTIHTRGMYLKKHKISQWQSDVKRWP